MVNNAKKELAIERIESLLKEVLRRMDNQDRYIELIYKDRELINETKESVGGLKDRVVDQGEHMENVLKDHNFEMSKQVESVKDVVETSSAEVKEDVVRGITGALTKSKGIVEKILR